MYLKEEKFFLEELLETPDEKALPPVYFDKK